MNISFEGYNRQVLSFEAGTGVAKGDLVKLSANGTVAKAASGESIVGEVVSVRGGTAGVLVQGYTVKGYTGSVALGYNYMVADGTNKLTVPGTSATDKGRQYLVVEKDTTASTIGVVLY